MQKLEEVKDYMSFAVTKYLRRSNIRKRKGSLWSGGGHSVREYSPSGTEGP